jgi:hypothetical protein
LAEIVPNIDVLFLSGPFPIFPVPLQSKTKGKAPHLRQDKWLQQKPEASGLDALCFKVGAHPAWKPSGYKQLLLCRRLL